MKGVENRTFHGLISVQMLSQSLQTHVDNGFQKYFMGEK